MTNENFIIRTSALFTLFSLLNIYCLSNIPVTFARRIWKNFVIGNAHKTTKKKKII